MSSPQPQDDAMPTDADAGLLHRVVPRPYYERGGITIYHGDCREIMPSLSGIDMVFTSPPYNLGLRPSGVGSGMHSGSGYSGGGQIWNGVADLAGGYSDFSDDMDHDAYDEWQESCVGAMWETLSDTGAIFYNHKPRPFNRQVKLPIAYGRGLPLRQIITWDRGVGLNFSTSHFLPKCEWVLVWAKNEWRLADRRSSAAGDVWRIPPESDREHPAPFPVRLPQTAIAATTAETVLDPFMGSGTTLVAARAEGRKAIGIDVSERYCEIAANRLSQGVLF
jgi:site-specific DNA-methyltransferase (adenine-specific)